MLGIGVLLILPALFTDPQRLLRAEVSIPLGVFLLFSLTAIVFSTDPAASLSSARHLLLILMVPLILYAVGAMVEVKTHLIALAAGAIPSAIFGFYQVASGTAGGSSGYRLTSTLGHYMTAGGVFMLISLALMALAFFHVSKGLRLPVVLVSLITITAVVLSQSRNAYIGLAIGLVALAIVWRKKLVFLLPFVAALLVLLSPPVVRDAMYGIVNVDSISTQSRVWMVETGFNIIVDHPLFGVGLGRIQDHYDHYKPPGTMGGYPHLHNNAIELAAERGIPAMIAWLWLMYVFGKKAFILSQADNRSAWRRVLGTIAFAAVLALISAGLFERNWGDAEVQMLFLALATLPIAAGYSSASEADES